MSRPSKSSTQFKCDVPERDTGTGKPVQWRGLRACTHKIAIGDSNLINVRFGPLCGLKSDIPRGPRSANNGLTHRSKNNPHSMISSASAKSLSETVRPSALAVLRLITSSNFDGCSTGRSLGLAPLRIRST
jgi:hypothetical protein